MPSEPAPPVSAGRGAASADQPAPWLEGRYSDGRTAAGQTAVITFAADALRLVLVETGETRAWPYAGLTAAEPIARSSASVLLRSAAEPGATLFVNVPAFATDLIGRARHLSAGAERWRYLKPALAVVAVVGIVSLLIWAFDLSPSRSIARTVPERTWDAAGRQLASTFERDYPGCTETAGRAALDKIVSRLSRASGDPQPFTIHLANWTLVNAFAMPGRHLMLTRGLIRDAQTPEEIAGVLGHEMGHGLEQHPEAGIVRQLGLAVATKLVFLGSPESLQSLGGLLVTLRYTREAERQADQRAFALLRQARVSTKPLGDFFDRMAKKEGSDGAAKIARKFEVLSSHPALEERAQNARSQPDYATEPLLSGQEWLDLRNVCGRTEPKSGPAGVPKPLPQPAPLPTPLPTPKAVAP